EPASFLLKEHAQLALYASDVEKIYNEAKVLASPKVQITNAQLDRDYSGRVSARVSMLIAPEESESLISRVKGFGRVENFQSLNGLGRVEDVSVQRQGRIGGQIDEASAPADISIQVYSQGNIVSSDTGLVATLRRTLAQSAAAIMWSLRMIGVAVAFLAPWAIAVIFVVWIAKRIARPRQQK